MLKIWAGNQRWVEAAGGRGRCDLKVGWAEVGEGGKEGILQEIELRGFYEKFHKNGASQQKKI